MRISKLCFEVNGGDCKNKVSVQNGYICAAGHSRKASPSMRPSFTPAPINDLTAKPVPTEKQKKMACMLDINLDLIGQKERLKEPDPEMRGYLAWNPSIEDEIQEELYQSGDKAARKMVLLSPMIYLTHSVQQAVLAKGDPEELFWLSMNTSISIETALSLAIRGNAPYGYVSHKEIPELTRLFYLVEKYPLEFGAAYLERLMESPFVKSKRAREENRHHLVSAMLAKQDIEIPDEVFFVEDNLYVNKRRRLIQATYDLYAQANGELAGYYKEKIDEFFPVS